MARVAPRKRSNVGVAISATRVVAWMSREGSSSSGEEWAQDIAPMPPTASEWPELEIALRALAADSGGGSLFLALLPPLVQVRSIQLPPVDAEDALVLVTRGAGKYFSGAREPQVISVNAHEGEKGEPTMALACAASARVIQAVREAVNGAGWKVARIVPAQSAWLTAADHVWAKSDALVDHGRLIVVDEDRTEVIFKRGGRAESFRHLRGLGDDGEKLLELIAVTPDSAQNALAKQSRNGLRPVAIIGADSIRHRLAPVLRERGLQPMEPEGVWKQVMTSPSLCAAHFAPLTEDLELVTQQARNTREASYNRLAVVLGGVAAAMFLGGLGAQYWGLEREVAFLQAKRDSIKTAVTQVRDAQRRIGTLGAPIGALDSLRSQTIKWSLVLEDIAAHLPADAYATSIRMKRDSVNVDGQGKDAGTALESLRASPSLMDVKQAGQIRRDAELSYFNLVAKVKRERVGGDPP